MQYIKKESKPANYNINNKNNNNKQDLKKGQHIFFRHFLQAFDLFGSLDWPS